MEINEKLCLLKLNAGSLYDDNTWMINVLNSQKKASVFFENDLRDFIENDDILEKNKKIIDDAKKFDAEQELNNCEKNGICVITYLDEDYPDSLRDIPNPPLALYIKGNFCKSLSISIVGTRHPTEYGLKNASVFAYQLASAGIVITSGLARGIDTVSHKNALKAKGKTVAVIGSGLDRIYPPENKDLTSDIVLNGGSVLSEYPLGTSPLKFNFPKRNRIISALSFATLVIEGDYNSGSLITARYAIEQGRDVMAVPGRIDSRLSNGPNKLIKDGAYPITNVMDIISLIPFSEIQRMNIKNIDIVEEKKLDVSDRAKEIYELLKVRNALTPDEISIMLKIDISELFNYIFELESLNAIVLLAGKYKINY